MEGLTGQGGSPLRVLTCLPVIKKKKLTAKSTKNNVKKMVQNPNLSNSDKNDDGDCCKG
jgi:hypothetical protein